MFEHNFSGIKILLRTTLRHQDPQFCYVILKSVERTDARRAR